MSLAKDGPRDAYSLASHNVCWCLETEMKVPGRKGIISLKSLGAIRAR